MTVLRQWILAITAAAMLIALAESLMPTGAVRRIGKLTGGLILLIVVLQPVLKMEYGALAESLSRYRADLGEYEAEPQTGNFYLMKSIIESKSAAYILDKAEELGISCQVQVHCTAEDTQSYPYPESVEIEGDLSADEIARLQTLIEAEMAIPAQRQSYGKEGGETP